MRGRLDKAEAGHVQALQQVQESAAEQAQQLGDASQQAQDAAQAASSIAEQWRRRYGAVHLEGSLSHRSGLSALLLNRAPRQCHMLCTCRSWRPTSVRSRLFILGSLRWYMSIMPVRLISGKLAAGDAQEAAAATFTTQPCQYEAFDCRHDALEARMEVLRAERRAVREAPPEVLERHARVVAQLEQASSQARNDLAVLRTTADKVRFSICGSGSMRCWLLADLQVWTG